MIVTLQKDNATMIGTMINKITTSTNKIFSSQQGKYIYKGKNAMMFYNMGAIEFWVGFFSGNWIKIQNSN